MGYSMSLSDTRQMKIERLTQQIVCVTRAKGECLDSDLHKAGFTPAEVADLGPFAKGLAAVTLGDQGLGDV